MVHTFEALGCYIAVDVNSGAVHVLDKMMYDLLREVESCESMGAHCPQEVKDKLNQYPTEELDECWAELLELQEQGLLFEKDDYVDPNMAVIRNAPVKALCLNVSHDCNLRCKYCFASTGDFGLGRKTMSVETAKKAIDFVVKRSGVRHNIEVDFFGGEPLMNFDVVKRLVAYARSVEKERGKHFRFTLTTNGVLIDDDVIDFANREMSNVVLSLDGRKEVHDRYRVDYAGNGSWEKIVPKFQKLVQARQGKNYYMRGTFTHANPDFLKDIQTMLDLGFTELSMEPVVAAPGDPAALTEADKEIVMQQYEELARLMLQRDKEGRPFTFYHYMIDLKGGPCIYKRISGCGSGTEYMAVTPWGDLYPCHQFVGDEKFKLGNIWDGVENHAMQAEFAGCNVYAREECRDCWARLYCSGGCAANAYHATGSVRGVYADGCDLFRKRMECAIAVAVARELGTE